MDFDLLYKFFEGLTSEEENEKIKAWLDTSPENANRLRNERKIYDAIILNSKESEVRVSNLAVEQQESRPKIPLFVKEVMKIAAVILVTLLGGWYFLSDSVSNEATAMQTIKVPAGQRINLVLPDGTDVWLNAGTKIQYPVSFNTKERLITIDGQAYFDVAKNEKVPFIVKSPHGTVQALGTKFDVLDYSDDDDFEAMLMEGSIKVGLDGNDQSLILTPDNKAVLDNGELKAVNVNDQSSYQWKEGLISFRNKAFREIMESFEKTYDIKIVLENKKIENVNFTGKFRIIDGVEYALRVLQREMHFRYERDNDKNIIYIK